MEGPVLAALRSYRKMLEQPDVPSQALVAALANVCGAIDAKDDDARSELRTYDLTDAGKWLDEIAHDEGMPASPEERNAARVLLVMLRSRPAPREANCCEHGDHEAPEGKRFCSADCLRCEYESESEDGCDGICGKTVATPPPVSAEPMVWSCPFCVIRADEQHPKGRVVAACRRCTPMHERTPETHPNPLERLPEPSMLDLRDPGWPRDDPRTQLEWIINPANRKIFDAPEDVFDQIHRLLGRRDLYPRTTPAPTEQPQTNDTLKENVRAVLDAWGTGNVSLTDVCSQLAKLFGTFQQVRSAMLESHYKTAKECLEQVAADRDMWKKAYDEWMEVGTKARERVSELEAGIRDLIRHHTETADEEHVKSSVLTETPEWRANQKGAARVRRLIASKLEALLEGNLIATRAGSTTR